MHCTPQTESTVRYTFTETPGLTFSARTVPFVEITLRNRLRRSLSAPELGALHARLGFEVPVCNVCGTEPVPYRYTLAIDESCGRVSISGFVTPRQFQYCYGASPHCKTWAKGKGQRNSNSAEFVSAVMNVSREEALAWIKVNNKSPFYRESHSSEDEYKAGQSHGLSYHQRVLGTEAGAQKNKTVWEKANFSRSLPGYIRRYGEAEGLRRYAECQALKDCMTQTALQGKNPQLTEGEVAAKVAARRNSVGLTREQALVKHGAEWWGKLQTVRTEASKGRTDIRFRKEHGEEAFSLLKERRRLNSHGGSTSKWAQGVLDKLLRTVFQDDPDVRLRFGSPEFRLWDPAARRWYYYDLLVETELGQKVVEFNGVCYHAPPWLSREDRDSWRKLGSRDSWETSRRFDLRKQSLLGENGLQLLVVWDNETLSEICAKVGEFIYG